MEAVIPLMLHCVIWAAVFVEVVLVAYLLEQLGRALKRRESRLLAALSHATAMVLAAIDFGLLVANVIVEAWHSLPLFA